MKRYIFSTILLLIIVLPILAIQDHPTNSITDTMEISSIVLCGNYGELCRKIKNDGLKFLIEPKTRFKNNSGEQGTFFIKDPSGNTLEFKSFKDENDIFKK